MRWESAILKGYVAFLDSVRFLTRIPLPVGDGENGEKERHPHPWTMAMFPVAGLLLGGILWSLSWPFGALLPRRLDDLILLAVLAALTGAIHWDGLMDTADALGAPRERRLEVLKDVRIGGFGILSVGFAVGIEWNALESLQGWMHGAVLLLFPVVGRWTMVAVALKMPDIREGKGLASRFLAQLEAPHLWWSGGFTLLCATLLLGLFRGVVIAAVILLVVWGLRQFFLRTFGGVTGDLLGASCCVGEAACLVAAVALA